MRLRHLFTSLSVAALAATIAVGCSNESPTAPQSPPALAPLSSPNSTLLSTSITAIPLNRSTPLATDITVSKSIGILGGTIAIPGAGVSVVIPPLALTKSTTISMTARAGSAVEYDFAPHGLKFTLPVVMTQNLTGMQGGNALLSVLQLGYYPDGTKPTVVNELL